MATPRIADSVGRVLGDRYRLTRPLGSGASAAVFVAEDVRLRRRVAVKVLHPGLATEEAFLRRFRREAQAVASLRHANILRVYDWGEEGDSPYLVMELLEGGTLRSMLDRGALLSAAQAAEVGAGAAKALAHAHRNGLVHRDIKPANLIFDEEGHVYVADFGLARALAEASWTEPNGAVVGTARYASPELVRGEHLDAKADVYSLALVLVEAMTGQVPFAADTAMGSLMARIGRSLEPPPETGPLAPVLAAAGTLDVSERLDAAALAGRLEKVAQHLPPPAPLSLGGPVHGEIEFDGISPTQLPGRVVLFDGEAAEPAFAGGIDLRSSTADPPADPLRPSSRPPSEPAVGAAAAVEAAGPRRSWWRRFVIATLAGVVILAGAGVAWALTTDRLAPEEAVPPVVGLSEAQATAAATRAHLHLVVTASAYSSTRPSGAVVSQVPATGRLRRGSDVKVVLSEGPAPVPVPTVANDPLTTAEQVLATLGIKWTVSTATSMTVPTGYVISTSPDHGTIVPGRTMALVESTGKPKVPVPAISVGTESAAQAEAALTAAGLRYTTSEAYSNTVPKGDVVSADPASGQEATVGSTVALTVSEGPHYVGVPSVAGDSVGSATETLDADGFDVTGVDGSPIGTVTGTDPGTGQKVLYGSSIVIVTG